MNDWKVLEVEGEFTISVPLDAQWVLDEDDRHFVIRLPTECATEVRISRHELRDNSGGKGQSLEALVRGFFDTCVPRAVGTDVGASVEPCRGQSDVIQGVATDGRGDWWLVRAYPVGSDYFWLQWCGPEGPLKDMALLIFESFTPVASGSADLPQPT